MDNSKKACLVPTISRCGWPRNPVEMGVLEPFLYLRRGMTARHASSGRGRGLRQGITGGTTLYPPAAPMDQTAELDMLKADAMSMKYGLEMIKRRIDELEKSGS